jgi:hypothetical protein
MMAILRLLKTWWSAPVETRTDAAFDPRCYCDSCEEARADYLAGGV